jgi:hypothetical protein
MESVSHAVTCALRRWEMFPVERGFSWILLGLLYALTSLALMRRWREDRVWRIAGILLLALTLGRILDLQALVTGTARCLVQQQGLYDFRRPVQVLAALVLLATAALILPPLLRGFAAHRLLVGALGLLLVFVLLRGLSLHQVDAVLARPYAEVPLARWIEAAALLPILFAALRRSPMALAFRAPLL